MKSCFSNTTHYLKETMIMLRLNPLSNLLSLLSTGAVFFILAMVIAGWSASIHAAAVIEKEAQVSIFFSDKTDPEQLAEGIKTIDGVLKARVVGEKEAYDRMAGILGEEAGVLKAFEENPFSPYIEVGVNLEKSESVLASLTKLPGVEYVRSNQEVLDRLKEIIRLIRLFGTLIAATVILSTVIIISHIIRLGVYNNREQIETLRLLGAPEAFIGIPFLLEGLVITLGGSILAALLALFTLGRAYAMLSGSLTFIPLPPAGSLMQGVLVWILAAGLFLGIAGSMLGLGTSRAE